ncbi:hypothetical protein [Nitrobacter winogradskyi]|uniref:Uncharacterized protein n=1 Tax=Nitrobacter winogradskyi TaxID=913 RepID=A0ACC6AH20_NITWI|nr:hypothetical protein [Nitrobacter winogradskyi]MCP1999043.1 hypothetical protein [Nitrobacter winogradskyi]
MPESGAIRSANDLPVISGCFRHDIIAARLGIGLEYRAARPTELRLIVPQAGDNTGYIGNFAAAQPEDIRRAGHPLGERAAIFFRIRSEGDAGHRQNSGKQDNSVPEHVPPHPNALHTPEHFSLLIKSGAKLRMLF